VGGSNVAQRSYEPPVGGSILPPDSHEPPVAVPGAESDYSYEAPTAFISSGAGEVRANVADYLFQGDDYDVIGEGGLGPGAPLPPRDAPPAPKLLVRDGEELTMRLESPGLEDPRVTAAWIIEDLSVDRQEPADGRERATVTSPRDRLPARIMLPGSVPRSSVLKVEIDHAAGHVTYDTWLTRAG
jgi:hypothetical protein